MLYQDLIIMLSEDKLSPEDAYLRVISKIGREKIPDIFSPNLTPLYYDITNIGDDIKKNPGEYFKTEIIL